MIFYRLVTNKPRARALVQRPHPQVFTNQADLSKAWSKELKDIKKAKVPGSSVSIERIELGTEFLTKSDWAKLLLGDSPGSESCPEEDIMYIGDLIEKREVTNEYTYKPEES